MTSYTVFVQPAEADRRLSQWRSGAWGMICPVMKALNTVQLQGLLSCELLLTPATVRYMYSNCSAQTQTRMGCLRKSPEVELIPTVD